MLLLPSDGTAGNLFATKLDTKQCTTVLENVWEYLLCWKTLLGYTDTSLVFQDTFVYNKQEMCTSSCNV